METGGWTHWPKIVGVGQPDNGHRGPGRRPQLGSQGGDVGQVVGPTPPTQSTGLAAVAQAVTSFPPIETVIKPTRPGWVVMKAAAPPLPGWSSGWRPRRTTPPTRGKKPTEWRMLEVVAPAHPKLAQAKVLVGGHVAGVARGWHQLRADSPRRRSRRGRRTTWRRPLSFVALAAAGLAATVAWPAATRPSRPYQAEQGRPGPPRGSRGRGPGRPGAGPVFCWGSGCPPWRPSSRTRRPENRIITGR